MGERDEAVIAAEVVAVEALKVRLKVAANDRVRSRWVGRFIVMPPPLSWLIRSTALAMSVSP